MTDGTDEGRNLRDLELAIMEYEQASEDARYRDQLLFTSFYLSLIFLGLSGSVVIEMFQRGSLDPYLLFVVSGVSLAAFYILLSWAYSVKSDRNVAWKRRQQIERMELDLRLNSEIVDRDQKPWEGHQSMFVIGYTVVMTAFWAVLMVYSVGRIVLG